MLHYDESYSTLLFATRAMSVKTIVNLNQKVEYKLNDGSRSINPMMADMYAASSQNEMHLIKQNS